MSSDASPSPDPTLAEVLARNLVAARDLHAMTQHDLAARSGVSRATIAQLEAGGGDPRLSTVSLLAEALGVSLMVLLAGKREVVALAKAATVPSAAIPAEESVRIATLAGSGESRDWRRAVRLAAALARLAGCQSTSAQVTAGLLALSDIRALSLGSVLARG